MGIFDASNESYLREEDVEDPELDEGEFRSFYVIVKNNNLDDRRDVPVWFRVDGGIEQPMNELEHYSRSPYIVHYPNFGETKGLILSPNRNSKIFPAEFVPYCVAFLDHISPLCSAEGALSGANSARKSKATPHNPPAASPGKFVP